MAVTKAPSSPSAHPDRAWWWWAAVHLTAHTAGPAEEEVEEAVEVEEEEEEREARLQPPSLFIQLLVFVFLPLWLLINAPSELLRRGRHMNIKTLLLFFLLLLLSSLSLEKLAACRHCDRWLVQILLKV